MSALQYPVTAAPNDTVNVTILHIPSCFVRSVKKVYKVKIHSDIKETHAESPYIWKKL